MLYIVVSNERHREMAAAGTLAYESFEFFFFFWKNNNNGKWRPIPFSMGGGYVIQKNNFYNPYLEA